jgi:hypothetical protein
MIKAHTLACMVLLLAPVVQAQEPADEVLRVPLSGEFASEIKVTGGPWLASAPEQPLALTFTASGLAGVKQFDMVVRLEPADAFDASSFRFITESPFLNPVGVDLLSEVELKTGAAILGTTAVDGEWLLGTLMMQTSAQFDPSRPARLVIQSFSIGPTSFERDTYTESDLELSIVVSEVPIDMATVVDVGSWGSVKALRGEED